MGRSRDTGFLRNLLTYDASGNITTTGTLSGPAGVVYATQSYVGTQLAALVASAPATLDTLNELATALGNDPNFATTVATSIGNKLPLSGGTLTGALTIGGYDGQSLKLQAATSTGSSYLRFYNSAAAARGYLGLFWSGTSDYMVLDAGSLEMNFGSSNKFTFTGGGPAIFSGALTTNSDVTISTGSIKLYTVQNAPGQYRYIGTEYAAGNGNNKAEIRFGIDGSDTRTKISFHVANGGGTINEALSIGYTGATTFASSITAAGEIKVKVAGNYGGFVADNNTSATIGGGFYSVQSFGVARGLFSVAGAISGTTDNNVGIFAEGGAGMGAIKLYVNGSGTASHIFAANGSVGIGTLSPGTWKAQIVSSSDGVNITSSGASQALNLQSATNNQTILRINNFNGNFYDIQNNPSTNSLTFDYNDTVRLAIQADGAIVSGRSLGNNYGQTSGGGTGTAIVDTGVTYNTGDYGGFGRGATYMVVFNGNPNAGGSAAYFAQYTGILMIYTGWSGSALTTYISYTQLAAGNNIGTLTLTPTFWNGSSESSSIGYSATGYQIRLKISGYNSSYTGQDQSVYLKRLS